MGNVKESIKLSVHPEKWNLKRYQREDEVFGNIGDKMTRMWDRVTNIGHHDDEAGPSSGRKRAYTNESDRYDYSRGRFPAVNDLHPPSVSQLPPTKEQAAWMLLPPPSAAVMAGKKRPNEDQGTRRPLCIIGRPPERGEQSANNERRAAACERSKLYYRRYYRDWRRKHTQTSKTSIRTTTISTQSDHIRRYPTTIPRCRAGQSTSTLG